MVDYKNCTVRAVSLDEFQVVLGKVEDIGADCVLERVGASLRVVVSKERRKEPAAEQAVGIQTHFSLTARPKEEAAASSLGFSENSHFVLPNLTSMATTRQNRTIDRYLSTVEERQKTKPKLTARTSQASISYYASPKMGVAHKPVPAQFSNLAIRAANRPSSQSLQQRTGK